MNNTKNTEVKPEDSAAKIPVQRLVMLLFSFIGNTYTLVFLAAFNGIRSALIDGPSLAIPWVCVLIVLGAHSTMEVRIQNQKKHNDYLFKTLGKERGKVTQLQYGLSCAQVGSCTCLTKTPETEYHAKTCRYRMLQNMIDAAA